MRTYTAFHRQSNSLNNRFKPRPRLETASVTTPSAQVPSRPCAAHRRLATPCAFRVLRSRTISRLSFVLPCTSACRR